MHDEFHFGGVLILNCLDCSPCTLLGPTKGSKVWIKYMIISSCFKIFVNALVLMQTCDMIINYFVIKRSLSFTLGYLKKILKIFLYKDLFIYSVQIFCKWFKKGDFIVTVVAHENKMAHRPLVFIQRFGAVVLGMFLYMESRYYHFVLSMF